MRFDTPVYFQKITQGAYDEKTGDYGNDTISEEKRFASVTNTGIDTIHLVYGELKQGVVTVRLQNYYNEPFERLRIGNTVYSVDRARMLRTKQTLICSEVQ